MDTVFLTLAVVLLVYSVADWRGWLPFERSYAPLQMVYLSAALATQSAASLLQRRSMLLYFALLLASIVLLFGVFRGLRLPH